MRDLAESQEGQQSIKIVVDTMSTSMQTAICSDELDKLAVMADKIHNITAPNVPNL